MSFLQDVNKWLTKVKVRYDQSFQNICYDFSTTVAERSPVSSGHLLGSYAPSKGTPSTYYYPGGESAWKVGAGGWFKDEAIASANRRQAMANLEPRIKATTESLEGGDTFILSNNVEYFQVAEFEGWVPYGGKQAPYRMINRTVDDFEVIVAKAVKRAKQVV
jgi:hypothetical protein